MSEAKLTGRKVDKPGCATVRNQATALFSLPMRLGQHVPVLPCVHQCCHVSTYVAMFAPLVPLLANIVTRTPAQPCG